METPRDILIDYTADTQTPYPIQVHEGRGIGECVQLRSAREIVNTNQQIGPVATSINPSSSVVILSKTIFTLEAHFFRTVAIALRKGPD